MVFAGFDGRQRERPHRPYLETAASSTKSYLNQTVGNLYRRNFLIDSL